MGVLLINASPKNYGATQEILITVKNALPAHIEAEIVCLGDFNINYCKGCKACYETCRCVLQDDMESIVAKINEADIIVIAAPSYWADVPGQFKVFIDRCTVYSNTNPNPGHFRLKAGKKCFAIALRTGQRSMECQHIIDTIAHWCGHMEIDIAGSMYFCGINDKNDIIPHKEEICRKAREWPVR